MSIVVTSTAFANGGEIPARHTCDGDNVSPGLTWSGIPSESQSLVVICEDPDAPSGTWTHWVIYGLEPTVTAIPEGVKRGQSVLHAAKLGQNDFEQTGYGGPCPPKGKPHRYFFRVFALDATLDLDDGASRDEVMRAMDGHVLARGEMMGMYMRQGS